MAKSDIVVLTTEVATIDDLPGKLRLGLATVGEGGALDLSLSMGLARDMIRRLEAAAEVDHLARSLNELSVIVERRQAQALDLLNRAERTEKENLIAALAMMAVGGLIPILIHFGG